MANQPPVLAEPVSVTPGIPESEQLLSSTNATMAEFGSEFTVSIQTFVKWPAGSTFTQEDAANYIAELLHTAHRATSGELTFVGHLGLNADYEKASVADQPPLR